MRKTKVFSDVLLVVPLLIYKINNKIHNVSFNLPFRELGVRFSWWSACLA